MVTRQALRWSHRGELSRRTDLRATPRDHARAPGPGAHVVLAQALVRRVLEIGDGAGHGRERRGRRDAATIVARGPGRLRAGWVSRELRRVGRVRRDDLARGVAPELREGVEVGRADLAWRGDAGFEGERRCCVEMEEEEGEKHLGVRLGGWRVCIGVARG